MTVAELESLIRSGELAKVIRELRTMNFKQVTRPDLASYANIANRVGRAALSLRILRPIVRSESPQIIQATDLEKLEYANGLRLYGLFSEALQLLSELNVKQQPIVLLRTASCLMHQWKYADAIPYLRDFLNMSDPMDYSYVVGKINLAAAMVFEELDTEALYFLDELERETKVAGHQLLHGNSLELKAQVLIRRGNFLHAERTLNEAAKFLPPSSRYGLYLRKWHSISRSLRTNTVDPDLLKCRSEAQKQMEWETQRECDLYIGAIERDAKRLLNVYFGTPFDSYRKRLLRLIGEELAVLPSTWLWNRHEAAPPKNVFDVVQGKLEGSEFALDRGRLMQRTLLHLSSDFYRPMTTGSLFAELFPDEHFSQEGRADRIAQSIRRLRLWFRKHSIPLEIECQKGLYRLSFDADLAIRVPREKPELNLKAVSWKKFVSVSEASTFSKQDVMSVLKVSNATAKRLLRWALDTGRANASGSSTRRVYKFTRVA